jgi:hypothetical protein
MKCKHCDYKTNSIIGIKRHLKQEHNINKNYIVLFIKKVLSKFI